MTRRDWWLGVALIVAAIVLHTFVPRYEWQHVGGLVFVRSDRWTSRASVGDFSGGRWTQR